MLEPANIEELQAAVREHPRVLPIGGGTKSRLTVAGDDCQLVSTRKLTGVTEYEPSEYTFTALAGTPVEEIFRMVGEKGQFLPCSTLLRKAGATLGGAIASGLSGSGRFRFGGMRDFLLGVRYVSGEGESVWGGGKVVKNAAGFDLPKFMVGSLGRYGILAEVTFKVFPKPSSQITVRIRCASHDQAVERIAQAASGRWELYAIDYDPSESAIYARLGGPLEAIEALAAEISQKWPAETEQLTEGQGNEYWNKVREFEWAPDESAIVKIPITPKKVPGLEKAIGPIANLQSHYSVAGNVAYVASPDPAEMETISEALSKLDLRGMTVVGDARTPLWLGSPQGYNIGEAVKHALDPLKRFPTLNE